MAKAKKTDTGIVEDGKKQALDLAIAQISKQFGDGSIMKLGENHKVDVELLPSGCLSLDIALGGGYPKGRIMLSMRLIQLMRVNLVLILKTCLSRNLIMANKRLKLLKLWCVLMQLI